MVHLPFGALWIVHFTASPQARIRSGFLVARGAAWGPWDAGDHRDTNQILQGWALEQCQPDVTLGSRGRGSEYPPLPRCRGRFVLVWKERTIPNPEPPRGRLTGPCTALSGLVSTEGSRLGSPKSISQDGTKKQGARKTPQVVLCSPSMSWARIGSVMPLIPSLQCKGSADLRQRTSRSCPLSTFRCRNPNGDTGGNLRSHFSDLLFKNG